MHQDKRIRLLFLYSKVTVEDFLKVIETMGLGEAGDTAVRSIFAQLDTNRNGIKAFIFIFKFKMKLLKLEKKCNDKFCLIQQRQARL
jgi:hypothetical protein